MWVADGQRGSQASGDYSGRILCYLAVRLVVKLYRKNSSKVGR